MFRKFMVLAAFLACLVTCAGVPAFAQEVADDDAYTAHEVVAAPAVVDVSVPAPAPVEVPVQVITSAEVVTAEIDPSWFEGVTQSPWTLLAVMAAVTPMIMEIVKCIPGVAGLTANILRLLSVAIGLLGGLAVGLGLFGSAAYNIGVALLAGAAGGGGFTLIKWGSQAARGTGRGFTDLKTMTMLAVGGVLLLCMISAAGCGTTFTAKAGEDTTVGMRVDPPGQLVAKIEDKTACTVNASGPLLLEMTCKPGFVQWYVNSSRPSCIPNPCETGTLTHLPDATVRCR